MGKSCRWKQYHSGDWQSLWSRTRGLRQKSRLCTLTYNTPVDRSDTGIDIDTSFNDMVEEESSTRPPDEKGGLKPYIWTDNARDEVPAFAVRAFLPIRVPSTRQMTSLSVLDAVWVSSDQEEQQSNPSGLNGNLPPIVLNPWPHILQAALLASKSSRIGPISSTHNGAC